MTTLHTAYKHTETMGMHAHTHAHARHMHVHMHTCWGGLSDNTQVMCGGSDQKL